MNIHRSKAALQDWIIEQKEAGKRIGFVPTMGALHEGHLSLLQRSKEKGELTVVSIFVNPTQFNNSTDYIKYPRPVEDDINLLEKNGCDCLYLPSEKEIYPQGKKEFRYYDIGYLENILEGEYRHGHFKGVVQIVSILLEDVKPDTLYLGSKDYQQCMVLSEFIEKEKLSVAIEIMPILREPSGLAMSSRNKRLSDDEVVQAAFLYETLSSLKQNIKIGDLQELLAKEERALEENGFKVDYLVIAQAKTLHKISHWDGNEKIIALVAAVLGEVRLIDNLILN